WSQVIGTYDGAMLRLYVNGQLAASLAYAGGLKPSAAAVRLGSTNGNYFWKGGLDEGAFYDYALSATAVAGLYQATSLMVAPGTIPGTVFSDVNGDRIQQAGENGLSGWTVYLDLNRNGQLDAGEPTTQTDGQGSYRFDVATGAYTLGIVSQAG